MASITQLCRIGNSVIGGYKTVFQGRVNWQPSSVCNYTRKSAEQKLGIDKPKRPLTPFFKFMTQMRPALLAKQPGISAKEAIAWSSKHWQQLDAETKAQMAKEYDKDREDYKKIKAIYEASLTDQQKIEIKQLKEEMAEAKEKRKIKAEYKEMGRPKKPMSSYFLFMQSRKETFQVKNLKELQEKLKKEWSSLPAAEKVKFEKQAQDLLAKYKKDMETWELKMISLGRSDLVRSKTLREPRPRIQKTKQQELGCSDEFADSDVKVHTSQTEISKVFVQQPIEDKTKPVSTSQASQGVAQITKKYPKVVQKVGNKEHAAVKENVVKESENYQSTSEQAQPKVTDPFDKNNTKNVDKSKTIISSIKGFFKF